MSATDSVGNEGFSYRVFPKNDATAGASASSPKKERAKSLGNLITDSAFSINKSTKSVRSVSLNGSSFSSQKIEHTAIPILCKNTGVSEDLRPHVLHNPLPYSFAASSSSNAPTPSQTPEPLPHETPSASVTSAIDRLLNKTQRLLNSQSTSSQSYSTGSSSSSSPPPVSETSSKLDRAIKAVKELSILEQTMQLNKDNPLEISQANQLKQKLEQAIIEEWAPKMELITTLCKNLSPEELRRLSLTSVLEKIKEKTPVEAEYRKQSDIIESFDRVFYNEGSFKQLAEICAQKAVNPENKKFTYQKMAGGLGHALALNVVEGDKAIPLFVCKPVIAQPGGAAFCPFSDSITDKRITEKINEWVERDVEQLNRIARPGLSQIGAEKMTLYELAKEAVREGLVREDAGNIGLEEFKVILNKLEFTKEFVSPEQGERVLKAFIGLFNCDGIIKGRQVDLVRGNIESDQEIREYTASFIAEEDEQNRKTEEDKAPDLVRPFGGAQGIEVNHVVFSNRSLSKKYPSPFEKPLLSTFVKDLPVMVRTGQGKEEIVSTSTMVMEYSPNYGTLESANRGKSFADIPENQFYPEQIEKRFIANLIFGFADQNFGNELIVDKELIQTESGQREMVRLTSIDMGQANASEPLETTNPPFYIAFEYLKDPNFLENVHRRIQNVDFKQLINEIAFLYEAHEKPLTDFQIKSMIFRCENLKLLAENPQEVLGASSKKGKTELKDELSRIVTGKEFAELNKMFIDKKTSVIKMFKKSRKVNSYIINDKTYNYIVGSR